MSMEETITKDQERYLEERLVEIIVEPDEYGLEEAKTNRKSVVRTLTSLVNKPTTVSLLMSRSEIFMTGLWSEASTRLSSGIWTGTSSSLRKSAESSTAEWRNSLTYG